MNKEDYFELKVREGIVHKILDKLPEKSENVELIPALNKFIKDGDGEMFEEFRKFHDNKDIQDKIEYLEEKHKRLEEGKAELEGAIERDEAYID